VASLRSDLRAVLTDVPFLSDFRRASEIATVAPYRALMDENLPAINSSRSFARNWAELSSARTRP
jgi:hypothetical protein